MTGLDWLQTGLTLLTQAGGSRQSSAFTQDWPRHQSPVTSGSSTSTHNAALLVTELVPDPIGVPTHPGARQELMQQLVCVSGVFRREVWV